MTAPRLLGVVVSLALGIAVAAGAQRPIETTLDPTTITVGDPVRLVVSVTHDPADTVSWPEPPALAPFEVIGQRAVPPTTSDGRTVSTLELTLTAFELGRLEVPSFDIVVTGASGDPATLSTDPLAVSVDTVGLDEGGDIRDIKAPIGIPFDPLTLAPWVIGLALVVAVAWWLYGRYGRRDASAPVAPPPAPPRPAHEVAYESLAALEASGLLELGEVKTFHIRGSDIVRIYLQGRFGIDAMEMTTAEVLDQLALGDLDTKTRGDLRRLLERCDLVKFAKFQPDQATSHDLIAQARAVVDATRPVDPAPATPRVEERGAT